MDGEQNGTQAQQVEGQQQAAQQQAYEQQEAQGKHAKGTKADAGSASGVDAEAFAAQLAERDSRIEELEAQIAEAAKNAETADGLRAEIAALKQRGEDEQIEFSLLLAGCRNVKAARAVLGRPRRGRRCLEGRRTLDVPGRAREGNRQDRASQRRGGEQQGRATR